MADVAPEQIRDILVFLVMMLLAAAVAGSHPVAALCAVVLATFAALRYSSETIRNLWRQHPIALGVLEALVAAVALWDFFV